MGKNGEEKILFVCPAGDFCLISSCLQSQTLAAMSQGPGTSISGLSSRAVAELQTVREQGGGGKVAPSTLQLAGLVFAAVQGQGQGQGW